MAEFGDAAAYMSEADLAILDLATLHIRVRGARLLRVHRSTLARSCRSLADIVELLERATKDAPVTLATPFGDYEEVDVVRFLRFVYATAGEPVPADLITPEVLRLAHTLRCDPLLSYAKKYLTGTVHMSSIADAARIVDMAGICQWPDLDLAATDRMVHVMTQPIGNMNTPFLRRASDMVAERHAESFMKRCTPSTAQRLIYMLAADARRTRMGQPRATRDPPASVQSFEVQKVLEDGLTVNDVVIAIDVPSSPRGVDVLRQNDVFCNFRSQGIDWRLRLMEGNVVAKPQMSLEIANEEHNQAFVEFDLGLLNYVTGEIKVADHMPGLFRLVYGEGVPIFSFDIDNFSFDRQSVFISGGIALAVVRFFRVLDADPDDLNDVSDEESDEDPEDEDEDTDEEEPLGGEAPADEMLVDEAEALADEIIEILDDE
jgi:hypothetical protein